MSAHNNNYYNTALYVSILIKQLAYTYVWKKDTDVK